MYINDLPDSLNSTVRLFADDALLYGTICCDEDTADLQEDDIQIQIQIIQKIIGENAFEKENTKRDGLKFNPAFALTSL